MRRRTFIAHLSTVSVAWSLAAHAQGAMRLVAVVLGFEQGDQEGRSRVAAFVETLAGLGWSDGRNIRLDIRWAGANIANYKAVAREIATTSPEVVVAMTNPFVTQLKPLTNTIPVVFVQVSDPVGAGFVSNVTRPGGNITGFENFQPEIGGKWLELLKQAAPTVARVGIVLDPGMLHYGALDQFVWAQEMPTVFTDMRRN